jgi:hypothetical protein
MVLGLVDAEQLDPTALEAIQARLTAVPEERVETQHPKLKSPSKRRGKKP